MAKIQRSVQYRYLDRTRAGIGEKKLEQVLREALAEKRDVQLSGNWRERGLPILSSPVS